MKKVMYWSETKKEVEDFDNLEYKEKLKFIRSKFGSNVEHFTLLQTNQRNKFLEINLLYKEDLL